jgi:hypothetical protein
MGMQFLTNDKKSDKSTNKNLVLSASGACQLSKSFELGRTFSASVYVL